MHVRSSQALKAVPSRAPFQLELQPGRQQHVVSTLLADQDNQSSSVELATASLGSQDVLEALGLPTTTAVGRFNALESFTTNPSGPGRLVGTQLHMLGLRRASLGSLGRAVELHSIQLLSWLTKVRSFSCEFQSSAPSAEYGQGGIIRSMTSVSYFRIWSCHYVVQVYTTEVAILNTANLAAALLHTTSPDASPATGSYQDFAQQAYTV